VNSYKVYSDGWTRLRLPVGDDHEAMLRVLKDGLPYDGVRARISDADAVQCDQDTTEYADPFWGELLLLAAREAEVRIRHGDQPSRSPDGPVILPSSQRATEAASDVAYHRPATTELLSFGVG
jgi:hypothetical protein